MTLNIVTAAARLDGGQYGQEGSRELFAEMKSAGLVAVYGASDDLMEFSGAIDDEFGAHEVHLTPKGVLRNRCEDEDCPYHAEIAKRATVIKPIWDKGGIAWSYKTTIPHETFTIYEDDEPYCRGIVFALKDVPPVL